MLLVLLFASTPTAFWYLLVTLLPVDEICPLFVVVFCCSNDSVWERCLTLRLSLSTVCSSFLHFESNGWSIFPIPTVYMYREKVLYGINLYMDNRTLRPIH